MALTKRIDRKNRVIRSTGQLRLGSGSANATVGLTGNETSLGTAQYFSSASTKPWVKIYTSYQFYSFDGLGTQSTWRDGQLLIQSNSVEGVSSTKNTLMDLKSLSSNGSQMQTLDVIRNFYFRDTGAPDTYGHHPSMASEYNPVGHNWTTQHTNAHGNFSYSAAYGLPWFNEIIDATIDNAGITIPSQYDTIRRIGFTKSMLGYGQNHSTGMEWSNGNSAFGSWASGSNGNVGGIQVQQCFWFKDDLGNNNAWYLNGYYGSFCLGITRDLLPGGYTESPLDLFDYVVVNDSVLFEKEAADKHNNEPDTLILTGDNRAGLMWTISADDYTKLNTKPAGSNHFKIEFFKKGTTKTEFVDKSLGYHYGKTNNNSTEVKFSNFHKTKAKLFADPNAAARKKLEANTAAKDHLQYLDTVETIPTSGQMAFSDFYGTQKPLWAIEMRVGRRGSSSCSKGTCTYTYYYGWWGPPVQDNTSTITLRGTPSDVTPGFLAADSQGDMGLRMNAIQMRDQGYYQDIHIDFSDEMMVGKTCSRVSIIEKSSNICIGKSTLTLMYTFPTDGSQMKEINSRRFSSSYIAWESGYNPKALYDNDKTIIVVIS